VTEVLRYAAFTDDPRGGNPAGIVLDAAGLDDTEMQRIAAEVGFSETAFLVESTSEPATFDVRYFAPSSEVPFCGHATIASGVALGERRGAGGFRFRTKAGDVEVEAILDDGRAVATLTSVGPALADLEEPDLDSLLAALRYTRADLDPALPPRVAYAGAWHPVVALADRARLADLDYDFDALNELMLRRGWTTVQIVWRESPQLFHVRDPFPVGGVVEDPATGAAAAAFGHYLRALDLIKPPTRITIRQGDDLGRPSVLTVDVDDRDPRLRVSGGAVDMAGLG
jgi:PhzF family phenazine biosynthesis protein